MNMDKLSLVALLDEDKEMVMASLARDPSLPAAQITLEKAIDRVMYRYSEACGDPVLLDSAQYILQAMKNTLPVMDSVGEARTWNRQAKAGKAGLNLGPMALALLVLGLVLVIAVGRCTGQAFSQRGPVNASSLRRQPRMCAPSSSQTVRRHGIACGVPCSRPTDSWSTSMKPTRWPDNRRHRPESVV